MSTYGRLYDNKRTALIDFDITSVRDIYKTDNGIDLLLELVIRQAKQFSVKYVTKGSSE